MQYGVRLEYEMETISTREIFVLIRGLTGETPLAQVYRIRSETNSEMIKKFTREEKKIYLEWQKFRFSKMSQNQINQEILKRRNALF